MSEGNANFTIRENQISPLLGWASDTKPVESLWPPSPDVQNGICHFLQRFCAAQAVNYRNQDSEIGEQILTSSGG